ncbi:MAG: DNA-processing protein DprA [Candidatus Saccharibacteria bacterium]|nr:DNA-processing protein DprA [Candidatus Saccharibacteria bacterium]
MYELWLERAGYPSRLAAISGAPKHLYCEGVALNELHGRPFVAVVGSRKLTDYGREVTKTIVRELARQGVVIVSGLALGIDSVAHQAVLDANGTTIAVLPSTLEAIYPATHRQLAAKIVANGGALVTEYGEDNPVNQGSYVARNRIISGLSLAVIIPEAAERSGSLHTANFALEQGREVLVVPGSIFSPTSKGTNKLLQAGAAAITSVDDVFELLKLERTSENALIGSSDVEQAILKVLQAGQTDAQTLFEKSNLPIREFNQALTTLEITGRITQSGQAWTLRGV